MKDVGKFEGKMLVLKRQNRLAHALFDFNLAVCFLSSNKFSPPVTMNGSRVKADSLDENLIVHRSFGALKLIGSSQV